MSETNKARRSAIELDWSAKRYDYRQYNQGYLEIKSRVNRVQLINDLLEYHFHKGRSMAIRRIITKTTGKATHKENIIDTWYLKLDTDLIINYLLRIGRAERKTDENGEPYYIEVKDVKTR